MIGALVGLRQEARLLRRLLPDIPIAISNATPDGARRGTERLVAAGANALLSFGCAGGLSTSLAPGGIIVADHVRVGDRDIRSDTVLSERFGARHARRGGILHSDALIATHEEKHWLYRETGCLAVDMESGAVAQAGLPFAVLRVVCDRADCDLPPAARLALHGGSIRVRPLLASVVSEPSQLPALFALGGDAMLARRAMASFLDTLSFDC